VDAPVAYLSTFPPRRCGIAEFTRDLRNAVGGDGPVVAMERQPRSDSAGSGGPLIATIRHDNPADYRRAAKVIDAAGVGILSLQHEFGIFGGPDGAFVLELLDALQTPVVTTLHTVLRTPSLRQRAIINELGRRAEAVVVMTEPAARLLVSEYDIDAPIRVIPHGVPELTRENRDRLRTEFGFGGRRVALSFGLVGPGKGYEFAIRAMAEVREDVPEALYVILGATHPDLLAHEGEAYRDSLMGLVGTLGLGQTVRFEDRFVSERDVGRWLNACDLFLTPYPNLGQIVSGTLAFALGAGRAIVSTSYAYASEMLRDGRGLLVPPGSPHALARAISAVMEDASLQRSLEASSLAAGDQMRWPHIGARYAQLFREALRPRALLARPAVHVEAIGA
jgi:polysaccharide biosynthesis protein PslF